MCPKKTRLQAYISLVRSTLEYGAVIWDPFTQNEIDKIERLQRKAARFITNDYHSREPGSMTNMLKNLDLPILQQRRKELRLTFLFKIVENLVPAIPKNNYLEEIKKKRNIKPKQYKDFETKNIVEKYQTNNDRSFKIPEGRNTQQYKNSFFVRTVVEWNALDNEIVHAGSVDIFKARLKRNSI